MSKIWRFFLTISLLLTASPRNCIAQDHADDDIVFTAKPSRKDAIFNRGEKIIYDLDLKNNLIGTQAGTVGYMIMNLENKVLDQGSVQINLKTKQTKSVTLSIPSQPAAGFYKVNLLINVTEYDDTLRRVVGVDVKNIKSQTPKPADFDQFWANAKDSLAMIPMQPKVTLQPSKERKGLVCYLVEVKSWNNITIRGWLTMSKKLKPGKKVPVWLAFAGYGDYGLEPIYGGEDIAILAFNVRGQANSRDVVNPSREGYLTTDIQNRYKYILRGAILDVIRAVDFIVSRPELDGENILSWGSSMGGYLSIAAASLDKRIKMCAAFNPCFSDFRSLTGNKEWPMRKIEEYSAQRRIPLNKILSNLDYYDIKNFAVNLKCNSLMGIGLLDHLAPPTNSFILVNNLTNKNKLFIYPDHGHDVPRTISGYLNSWMFDSFGVF